MDIDFSSTYDSKKPIIQKYEKFALANNIKLLEGYKQDLARQFKQTIISRIE